MDPKKLLNKLIYPPIPILLILLPIATAFLVCSMVFLGSESPISIISYVLAAYTLTVWCFRIPYLIDFFKNLRRNNMYISRYFEDRRFRVKVSLYSSLIFNTIFVIFHFWLGIYHSSFWYCSLAIYYLFLSVMRYRLVRYTSKYEPGSDMRTELTKYRNCGIIFLLMNLTLSLIIFFMVYFDRSSHHHEITTIAIAAFTFTKLTTAIISIKRYRKYNSPAFSTVKAISLAAACVSMLTLEATMLTTFGGDGSIDLPTRRLMLALTGAVVVILIVTMAINMIIISTRKLNGLKNQEEGSLNE